MTVYFGADHRAARQSIALKERLSRYGTVLDVRESRADLAPDYVTTSIEVCKNVYRSHASGVLICGTGIGISIVANKIPGIYAARCISPADAVNARQTNCANVLCLSAANALQRNVAVLDAFFGAVDRQRSITRLAAIQDLEKLLLRQLIC